jgi:uncharacterized protein YlxW (UPF0749 family)
MKNNKLLALSLLACTLLAGCDEGTKVQNGEKPVGNVVIDSTNTLDTNLTLQSFYESLKTSNGGAKAVEVLLEKLSNAEYSDEILADTSKAFSVKSYHTTASLQKEISESEDYLGYTNLVGEGIEVVLSDGESIIEYFDLFALIKSATNSSLNE